MARTKTHLSLLVAALGDSEEAMRPLSRSISLLQRGIPTQIENLREALAPVMPDFEPLLDRYSDSVGRLRGFLEQSFTATDRLVVINRISRNEVDEILAFQHDGMEKLAHRTLRHVAGQIAKQGYKIFNLKPRKKPKKKTASTSTPGYGPEKGSIEFLNAPRLKKSKAETWPIENIIDVLDQTIARSPGNYYAAWTSLQTRITEWWVKLLRVFTSHVESIKVVLASTPIRTASLEVDEGEFLAAVERVQNSKLVKAGTGTLITPGPYCHQVRPENAVAVLMAELDEHFLPDIRAVKREVRMLHKASARDVTETSVYDSMLGAIGRWYNDLQAGILRPQLSAEFPLASRAQGDMPATEVVKTQINGAFVTRFTFQSVPISARSSTTSMEVTFKLSRRLLSRVLRAYVRDVDAETANLDLKAGLKDLVKRISGEVKSATKHNVRLASKVEDDRAFVFAHLETFTPVKRVPGSSPSQVTKTRAGLTAVLGSPSSVYSHATQANNASIQAVDTYHIFEDTASGVKYTITAVFEVTADTLTRDVMDDVRTALVYVAQMSNEDVLRAEAVPSRRVMVSEFVEVNGAAKVRVAGGRTLNRRRVVAHANIPGRTFEVIRSRKYGSGRKFTINFEGNQQIVSSQDGWGEVAGESA